MSSIKLEVVSPDEKVYEADISMLIVRSTGGELGILPKHAPLITGLIPHAMRVKLPGVEEQLIAVAGGFMEVQRDKITVLATAAELPINIDVLRAQRAYKRAKERLERFHKDPSEAENIDVVRVKAALDRAMARLRATGTEI